jgi:peptidoglycan/LPS O-acetylase OafA/YrhL
VAGLGVLSALGRVSYSLYLVHMAVHRLVVGLGHRAGLTGLANDWLLAGFAFLASLGAALVLHRWVEEPSRRLARRLGERPAPGAARPAGSVRELSLSCAEGS